MITALSADDSEPRYRFAEPVNDCWWPTTTPIRSASIVTASQVWLSGTRDDTIPLSSIKFNPEGRAA